MWVVVNYGTKFREVKQRKAWREQIQTDPGDSKLLKEGILPLKTEIINTSFDSI